MIQDLQNTFSDQDTITSTDISENVIDLLATNSKLGTGENLYCVLIIDQTLNDGGGGANATVTATVEADSAAALNASPEVIATFPVMSHGATAGTKYIIRLPVGYPTKRYLGIRYTVASGPLDAGKFTCFLTTAVDAWAAYPKSTGATIDLT
jgi:hypothetical protein